MLLARDGKVFGFSRHLCYKRRRPCSLLERRRGV